MSMSVSYDPSPKSPLGFTARVTPAWGGDAMSGADALWGRDGPQARNGFDEVHQQATKPHESPQ